MPAHFTHQLTWNGAPVRAPLPEELASLRADARYRYEPIDVLDEASIAEALARFRPDAIVHSAAALRDEPRERLFDANARAVGRLGQALATLPEPRPLLLVVSTGSVYGAAGDSDLPLRETAACAPADLYAASKRAGEDVIRIVAGHHEIPLILARPFNLLGPGLQDRHLAGSLAGQVAQVSLGLAPPVLRVGPLDTTRDFIDVRDAAAALITLVERGAPGEVYNVATGRETPTETILAHLLRVAGLDAGGAVRIDRLARRPLDVRRSYADVSRLASLGFEPGLDLVRTLEDMLDYCRNVLARSS
jgi:nucleoside-diphosphate-sugar epimerase